MKILNLLLLIIILFFSSCVQNYSGWIIENKSKFPLNSGGTFVISHPRDITYIKKIRVEEYTYNLYNIGDTIR